MPDQSQRDVLGQTMADGKRVLVPLLAEMLKSGKQQQIDASEERRRFWTPAITDEEEAALWEEAMMRAGKTPETMTEQDVVRLGLPISRIKYPDRWDMAGQEGRTTDAQQAEWALKHALKGPPKAMTDQEGQTA